MAGGEEKNGIDLYAVLGLEKECSSTELRDAYKKLVMRWHPDRCSASGNSKIIEEAKNKFQGIQEAYSVLSDQDKRLLYDVGVYDDDDDDNNNGMNDFLNEMTEMMSHSKPSDSGGASFEELQDLFKEIFQDTDGFSTTTTSSSGPSPSSPLSSFDSYSTCGDAFNSNNKRDSTQMNHGLGSSSSSSFFGASFESFCVGVKPQGGLRRDATGAGGRTSSKRRGMKQKVHCSHNISSNGLPEDAR